MTAPYKDTKMAVWIGQMSAKNTRAGLSLCRVGLDLVRFQAQGQLEIYVRQNATTIVFIWSRRGAWARVNESHRCLTPSVPCRSRAVSGLCRDGLAVLKYVFV